MQTFNLDLSVKRVIPLLYVKQRDVGTKIQIKLTDNKKECAIPNGVTWSVWYSGKSGEGNYTKVGDRNAVEVVGSTATVELIYQMLDNPGEHAMCLVMNGADGTQLGLWNIPYFVEAIPGADSKAATAYYQAFLNAQAAAEAAADRAEYAAREIVVDQEFIETQVFSVEQAAEIAATAARNAAQSEQSVKDDADRAAGAADDAAAALARTEEVADSVGSPVSYKAQTLTGPQQAQARKNIGADFSYFGYKYSAAVATYDLSADGSSVKMYLFPHDGGYAAVVSGKGAMKNHTIKFEADVIIEADDRGYLEHIEKINKVCVESGVTSIGDYFMYKAYYLKEVIFEDSSQIAYLGKSCFAHTQITGEFKFCNLENGTTIDRSFYFCPNLYGITLGVSATENRNFELSERAFCGCLNLQYFEVDKPLTTSVVLGAGSFEYCVRLKYVELQMTDTVAKGFNFILVPCTSLNVKLKRSNGSRMYWPITGFDTTSWKKCENIECTERIWAKNNLQEYMDCVAVASEYDGKRHELMIYDTDCQSKDEYLYYPLTADLDCKAVFWGILNGRVVRSPYYGSCWLFAYLHIWNTLHPFQMYDTIEDFVAKLRETKITIDSELATALAGWDFKDKVMAVKDKGGNLVYADGYFDEGKEIYVTDLPLCLKEAEYPDGHNTADYDELGYLGEAHWGVGKVLGWTGKRLTETTDRTWASIKKSTIDSIFAGKPVIFECVRYPGEGATIDNIRGIHAVTAIGYDAKTDKFKIVDSAAKWPSDEVPMEYWTTFEALLEPSGKSAVWVFSAFDSGAWLTPA